MTNTSFEGENTAAELLSVEALRYENVVLDPGGKDLESPQIGDPAATREADGAITLTADAWKDQLQQAAEESRRATTEELRSKLSDAQHRQQQCISEAIAEFNCQRADYYVHVEQELVHLALAIAARILHREAQVDRLLLAALAKVAVEKLQQRTHIVLRIAPAVCQEWRSFFSERLPETAVEFLADSQLELNECVLETELGRAEVGIEAQLKEIERGFFDLLAKRPVFS